MTQDKLQYYVDNLSENSSRDLNRERHIDLSSSGSVHSENVTESKKNELSKNGTKSDSDSNGITGIAFMEKININGKV